MKAIFSSRAERDLVSLVDYIGKTLDNKIAARNITSKVLRLSQKLSAFPELGAELKAADSRLGEYRYLIVDNYLLIYRITTEEVFIVRILYAKSDYVQLLGG